MKKLILGCVILIFNLFAVTGQEKPIECGDNKEPLKMRRIKNYIRCLHFSQTSLKKILKKIKYEVLIMSGDRDAIRLEHSIKIFSNIENANFFVMPGTSHFGSYEKPELFNLVLSEFLNKPFSKLSTVEIFTKKN